MVTMELVRSEWSTFLQEMLIDEFCLRGSENRSDPGALCARMELKLAPSEPEKLERWVENIINKIGLNDEKEAVKSALLLMEFAFEGRFSEAKVPQVAPLLLDMLDKSAPSAHSAAWALNWVYGVWRGDEKEKKILLKIWEEDYTNRILNLLPQEDFDSNALRFLIPILGWTKNPKVVEPIIGKLEHENVVVVREACRVLGEIKDPRSVEPLLRKLDDSDWVIRQEALGALAKIIGDEIDQRLLSNDFEAEYDWSDPQEPISEKRIGKGAETLNLSEEEVRRRYEVLAEKFNLKLEWKTSK